MLMIALLLVTLVLGAVGSQMAAPRLLGERLGVRLGVVIALWGAVALLVAWYNELMSSWRGPASFATSGAHSPPAIAGPIFLLAGLLGAVSIGVAASALPISVLWKRVLIVLLCIAIALYFLLIGAANSGDL